MVRPGLHLCDPAPPPAGEPVVRPGVVQRVLLDPCGGDARHVLPHLPGGGPTGDDGVPVSTGEFKGVLKKCIEF